MSSWTYLINPAGVTVEVANDKVDGLLKKGFRLASEGKVSAYQAKRKPLRESIYFSTTYARTDGYGQSQQWLKEEFAKLDIQLSEDYTSQEIGLAYGYPHHLETMQTPVKYLYSMFESTKIPKEWVKQLKLADKIFVPSKFCQKAFKSRGVDTQVIPLGYNETYKYGDNRPKKFTFLHYDAFNTRKGWDKVFQAFTEEFKEEEAELILKTVRRPLIPIRKEEYPNITVIREDLSEEKLRELIISTHVLVFPSKGEGFGLPPLECLACGTPSIIPNGSGMSEYFNDKYFYQVKHKPAPSMYQQFKGGVGEMIDVEVKDLRKVMRQAFNDKDIKKRGKEGSKWVEQYKIENTVKKLKVAMKTPKKAVKQKPTVAFLMDNIAFYSGGRYHNFMQAIALQERYDVTVYTNQKPVFWDDFKYDKRPPLEIVDLNDCDIEADIYFGSPEPGAMTALRLGHQYDKPILLQVFDPPEWMEQSDHCHPSETKRHHVMKDWIHEHKPNKLKIICNTHNAIKSFIRWYELPAETFAALNPPLNSSIIRLFNPKAPKKNWIYAASRVHLRKAWEETLQAFRPYAGRYQLHIVSQSSDQLYKTALDYGIPKKSLVVHSMIGDLEKYAILAQCQAVISSSHFEGFGIFVTEGRALGVPVALYDLPAQQHIDTGVYKAPIGDVHKLSEALGKAIQAKGRVYKDHDLEVNGKQLCDIVDDFVDNKPKKVEKPKISAMYIVLNEEKYISASLKSILRRPEVKEVIIVEGADKTYPRANKKGLSVDKTAQKIRRFKNNKIKYIRYGWAENKEELRQKCIDESSKKGWGLFIDGDEVWEDDNWARLIDGIEENENVDVIYFKHLHFWKDYKHIAVGSQWDNYLFRLFKFTHDNQITFHGGPPTNTEGKAYLEDVSVHHYGACKDKEDIKAKLAYYQRRDKDLNVRDTWSNYKKGDESQWTHGGGDVKKYFGSHPKEICKS